MCCGQLCAAINCVLRSRNNTSNDGYIEDKDAINSIDQCTSRGATKAHGPSMRMRVTHMLEHAVLVHLPSFYGHDEHMHTRARTHTQCIARQRPE